MLALLGVAAPSAIQASDARAVVADLEAALITTMKNAERLGFKGRYEALAPVVARTYDLPYIGRLVLSTSWMELGEEQRARFATAFEKLVVSTFAGELGAYRGQRFKFELEKPLRRGRILIRSRLVEQDGGANQFDYRLQKVDGRWRVINVSVDGVSDLALKRSEYGTLVRTDGFEALISRIQSQIRQYEQDLR